MELRLSTPLGLGDIRWNVCGQHWVSDSELKNDEKSNKHVGSLLQAPPETSSRVWTHEVSGLPRHRQEPVICSGTWNAMCSTTGDPWWMLDGWRRSCRSVARHAYGGKIVSSCTSLESVGNVDGRCMGVPPASCLETLAVHVLSPLPCIFLRRSGERWKRGKLQRMKRSILTRLERSELLRSFSSFSGCKRIRSTAAGRGETAEYGGGLRVLVSATAAALPVDDAIYSSLMRITVIRPAYNRSRRPYAANILLHRVAYGRVGAAAFLDHCKAYHTYPI